MEESTVSEKFSCRKWRWGYPGVPHHPKVSRTRGALHRSCIHQIYFLTLVFTFSLSFLLAPLAQPPLTPMLPMSDGGGRSNWIYRLSPLSFFGHVGGRGPVQQ